MQPAIVFCGNPYAALCSTVRMQTPVFSKVPDKRSTVRMQAPAFSKVPAKVLCMTDCSICVEGNDARKCSRSFVALLFANSARSMQTVHALLT